MQKSPFSKPNEKNSFNAQKKMKNQKMKALYSEKNCHLSVVEVERKFAFYSIFNSERQKIKKKYKCKKGEPRQLLKLSENRNSKGY